MASQKQGSWWGRNWKWFVPVLGFSVIILLAGFIAAIVMGVFDLMKSSDAYKIAVSTAKADPRVVAALGSPVEEGFFIMGNIHLNNDAGNAKLSIPISGPKGKATLHVVATKSSGKWSFKELTVQPKDGSGDIDLNDKRKQNNLDDSSRRLTLIDVREGASGRARVIA